MSNDAAMRVEVTALRAPWPAGTGVGDVVEINSDTLPGCFVGKCRPASANARAKFRYEPPVPVTDTLLSEASITAAAEAGSSLDFLTTKRDLLRSRIEAIDLPAAEKRLRDADAALARYRQSEVSELRDEHDRARTEAKAARVGLRSLQQELQSVGNDLKYVENLLGAESRVETARNAALATDERASICRKVVGDAEVALHRIAELVEAEEKAYESARDGAGARILQAIKAGMGLPSEDINAASRERVETLEVAKRGAEEELQVARTALRNAEQERRNAWQQVRLAQADAAELAFRQVEREYVETLIQLYVAKNQASASAFGVVDPRAEALRRSEQVCRSMA